MPDIKEIVIIKYGSFLSSFLIKIKNKINGIKNIKENNPPPSNPGEFVDCPFDNNFLCIFVLDGQTQMDALHNKLKILIQIIIML